MNWVEGRVSIPLLLTLLSNGSIAARGREETRGEEKEERYNLVYMVYNKICVLD